MELIKVILSEQSLTDGKLGDEYKKAGYVRIASSLVDSKKSNGDVKKDSKGKFWFKENASTNNQNVASSSGTSGTSGTTTVVNKQYTKYNAITPEDRIKGFRWRDCQNKDFPYEYGCKNTKIGQMNECLLDSTLGDIFGNDLWEKMKDLAIDNEKKEITQEMYDKVMLSCKQQEESIEIKKIIKENTYKILNQIK